MNILEFQEKSKITLCDLGSKEANILHMVSGVVSEVGEIISAYKKVLAYGAELDKTNVIEEAGDLLFFLVGLAGVLEQEIEMGKIDELVEENLEGYKRECGENTIIYLLGFLSEFIEEPEGPVSAHITAVLLFLKGSGFDLSQVLEKNVAKLAERYKGGFSEEKALNRDLEAERQELEK